MYALFEHNFSMFHDIYSKIFKLAKQMPTTYSVGCGSLYRSHGKPRYELSFSTVVASGSINEALTTEGKNDVALSSASSICTYGLNCKGNCRLSINQ